jgi:hypothetical protein
MLICAPGTGLADVDVDEPGAANHDEHLDLTEAA